MLSNFRFMKRALKQAYKALEEKEWPVGAVIVMNNKIIASGRNMIEKHNNPTAHAEIIVANKALQILGTRYLNNCDLFVTLQPCNMCYYYLAALRINKIIYGAHTKHSYCQLKSLDCIYEQASLYLLSKFTHTIR